MINYITIMKKLLLLVVMLIPVAVCAQENNENKLTKYEEFISKSGMVLKFEDIKFSPIPTYGVILPTRIRVIRGNPDIYFLGVTKSEDSFYTYSSSTLAMIEYSDLVEINKALDKLRSEQEADKEKKTDYLLNAFVTPDGFRVGYYIKKKSPQWFIELGRFDKTTSIDKPEPMIDIFKQAQAKIEELKKE